uniref:Carbohydrate sulfotransferase n=1 Tax=Phocoena sinus TaxID=42100 RepID=A0A8C9BZW1_PHOSS
MVMNPKQVFLSVLIFGVAGLLLFMYLQVWIEEQHTGNTSTFFSYFFFFFFLCVTRASHCRGLSRCGGQAPDAQAQRPWLTGPAAPRHVGSSRTGARTRVPCIGRRTPNHCATREALFSYF